MSPLIDKLISLWMYDVHVFSQPWMYYWLLIPAAAYLVFFMLKWAALTAPIWLPIVIIRAWRTGD